MTLSALEDYSHKMQKNILITGFEPFGNNTNNPSGDWVNSLLNKTFNERVVKGLILPVAFSECFEVFKKTFEEFNPDVIILTGFAEKRIALTVERIGINWIDSRIPDNQGVQPLSTKINEQGPDGLFTTIDIETLKKLAPTLQLSSSAGEYVCNYLLYNVLLYLKQMSSPCQATFIHLPGILDSSHYQIINQELNAIVEHI